VGKVFQNLGNLVFVFSTGRCHISFGLDQGVLDGLLLGQFGCYDCCLITALVGGLGCLLGLETRHIG